MKSKVIQALENITGKKLSYPSCIGKGKKNEGSGRGWDRKGAERLGKAAQ